MANTKWGELCYLFSYPPYKTMADRKMEFISHLLEVKPWQKPEEYRKPEEFIYDQICTILDLEERIKVLEAEKSQLGEQLKFWRDGEGRGL